LRKEAKMFTHISKIRRSIAVLVAVGAMAVAAGAIVPNAKAVTARPTGNAQQDAYCQGVAGLINDSLNQADYWASRDWYEYEQWVALAGQLARAGNENGCHFDWRRVSVGFRPTPAGGMAPAQR
jgi:hypothetical protein